MRIHTLTTFLLLAFVSGCSRSTVPAPSAAENASLQPTSVADELNTGAIPAVRERRLPGKLSGLPGSQQRAPRDLPALGQLPKLPELDSLPKGFGPQGMLMPGQAPLGDIAALQLPAELPSLPGGVGLPGLGGPLAVGFQGLASGAPEGMPSLPHWENAAASELGVLGIPKGMTPIPSQETLRAALQGAAPKPPTDARLTPTASASE